MPDVDGRPTHAEWLLAEDRYAQCSDVEADSEETFEEKRERRRLEANELFANLPPAKESDHWGEKMISYMKAIIRGAPQAEIDALKPNDLTPEESKFWDQTEQHTRALKELEAGRMASNEPSLGAASLNLLNGTAADVAPNVANGPLPRTPRLGAQTVKAARKQDLRRKLDIRRSVSLETTPTKDATAGSADSTPTNGPEVPEVTNGAPKKPPKGKKSKKAKKAIAKMKRLAKESPALGEPGSSGSSSASEPDDGKPANENSRPPATPKKAAEPKIPSPPKEKPVKEPPSKKIQPQIVIDAELFALIDNLSIFYTWKPEEFEKLGQNGLRAFIHIYAREKQPSGEATDDEIFMVFVEDVYKVQYWVSWTREAFLLFLKRPYTTAMKAEDRVQLEKAKDDYPFLQQLAPIFKRWVQEESEQKKAEAEARAVVMDALDVDVDISSELEAVPKKESSCIIN
ncbi:hypothetical protein ABW21_db0201447 [Orbilia brochopaga]|nr:hypothetical protein ABW21_db0201447 [Drechslerella brochopaga]